MRVAAVIFDLDGVLIDSEGLWDDARRQVAQKHGGRWDEQATRAMMGMSSIEWSRYMHDELCVPLPPEEISQKVVARLEQLYRERLPLLPGARETVQRLAPSWPLGLASSANRPIIKLQAKPEHCAAVEDSANGIRSAVAAGMTVFAVPIPEFPPPPAILASAHATLDSITELTPERLAATEQTG